MMGEKTMFNARFGRSLLVLCVAASALAYTGCARSPQAKRDKFLTAGKNQMEKKDYARAILEFKNAAHAMPKDPEAYYQAGLADLGLGDLKAAVMALRTAISLDPKHVGAQLKLAELMSRTDDKETLENAEKRVQSVLSLTASDPAALNTLALTEFKLGRPEEAEAHLQEALRKWPADVQSHANLAGLAVSRKDLKGAEAILKQAVEVAPKVPQSWIALARFYVLTRRLPEAEAQMEKVVELRPQDGQDLMDLGRLQYANDKADQADRTFRRISDLPDQKFKSVHALYLFRTGKIDPAIAELTAVVKKDPKNRDARTHLVGVYFELKRIPEAERLLTDAMKENPKDADAMLQRAQLYLATGKLGEAQIDLTKVIGYRPEDAVAHYLLSRVYKDRDQDLLRRQELSEALRLNRRLLRVRVELADALLAARTPKTALDVIDAAPDDQAQQLSIVAMRNWALLDLGEIQAARKGIAAAGEKSTASEFMLQDALLKLKQRNMTGAITVLEDVLKKNPADIRAIQALANSYFAEGKEAAGIAAVRGYASQQPNSAPIQEYLGQVLLISGDRAGARAALVATKKADPNDQSADIGLALLDNMEGNVDSARRILRTVMGGQKPNSLAAVRLGMVEDAQHNYPAAAAAYKKALETRTNDWVPLNNLADCLIQMGQYDEALKYAQQAKELAPTSSYVADTIGWALYNKGLYRDAVRQLEMFKGDPMAKRRFHLAMAYFKDGEADNGKAILQGALKLEPSSPEAKLAQQVAAEAMTAQKR